MSKLIPFRPEQPPIHVGRALKAKAGEMLNAKLLAVVRQMLTMIGMSVFASNPFTETQWDQIASVIVMLLSTLWSWKQKNNVVPKPGMLPDPVMRTKGTGILVALLTLWALPAFAQSHDMHVTVEPTQLRVGPVETVPRFALGPGQNLVVLAGQTPTLSGVNIFDHIEVQSGGYLRVMPGSTLSYINVQVHPGGRYRVEGTCAQPTTIIHRDSPMDLSPTTIDPWQFGNGTFNAGKREFIGCDIGATWIRLTQDDVPAGATSIETEEIPAGWEAGDKVLMYDSTQAPYPYTGFNPPQRDTLVIASIAGNRRSMTFTTGTGFERVSVRRKNGTNAVVKRPTIANLTRRGLTVTSVNPLNAGHIIDVGHDADAESRYTSYINNGRTCNQVLNSTPADRSSIGSCQAGRYGGWHLHHSRGLGSVSYGDLFLADQNLSKWPIAIHGTSDSMMDNAVIVGWRGAGYVTEDGNEVRNTFQNSFIAYIDPGDTVQVNSGQNQHNIGIGAPGTEGSCVWLRGMKGAIFRNIEMGNCRFGVSEMNSSVPHDTLYYPSTPGGPRDVTIKPGEADNVWAEFSNSAIIAMRMHGFDDWGRRDGYVDNLISAHAAFFQTAAGAQGGNVWFRNLTAIGGVICVDSGKPYIQNFRLVGSSNILEGCDTALANGLGQAGALVENVEIAQAWIGVNFKFLPDQGATLTNVRFTNMYPESALMLFSDDTWPIWEPGQDIPGSYSGPFNGCMWRFNNWNGSGTDYCYYPLQSARNAPAWTDERWAFIGAPEPGLTMGQVWDQYGIAWAGGVFDPAVAVNLPGVIGGKAIAGPLPVVQPRFTITYPMKNQIFESGSVTPTSWFEGAFTGPLPVVRPSDGAALDSVRAQFNSDPPQTLYMYTAGLGRIGLGYGPMSNVPTADGQHTLRTWRLDQATGNVIPGSEMVTSFIIGASTPKTPIDCAPGPTTFGEWTVKKESPTEQFQQRFGTFPITTQPENGGKACEPQPVVESRTITIGGTKPIPPLPTNGVDSFCIPWEGRERCWINGVLQP